MVGVDQPALLMSAANIVTRVPMQTVHLSKQTVVPVQCEDGVWVLDTGASNHMIGTHSALSQLDEGVDGTVRFGDGSCVGIYGLGLVVLEGRQQEHKVMTNIY